MTFGIVLATLFIYCFYGSRTSDDYLKMADCLYESNWQDLSLVLEKYVMLLILNAQQPLRYHGFGIAYLNSDTFSKVYI